MLRIAQKYEFQFEFSSVPNSVFPLFTERVHLPLVMRSSMEVL